MHSVFRIEKKFSAIALSYGLPLLDIDGFIDYMLINQYAGNNDWDSHNWFAFRSRTRADKGFRFICWDSEQIFEGAGDSNLGTNNSGRPTGIFNRLMKNKILI